MGVGYGVAGNLVAKGDVNTADIWAVYEQSAVRFLFGGAVYVSLPEAERRN